MADRAGILRARRGTTGCAAHVFKTAEGDCQRIGRARRANHQGRTRHAHVNLERAVVQSQEPFTLTREIHRCKATAPAVVSEAPPSIEAFDS